MNINSESSKKAKQSIKSKRKMLYFTLLVIDVVLFLVCFLLYHRESKFFYELISGLICNFTGIFTSFIVFDFFDKKLTREEETELISEQIAQTLMSNPKMLELFEITQRETFIQSTVKSLVKDNDAAEMLYNNFKYFFETNEWHRIRMTYQYTINLNVLPDKFEEIINKPKKYYQVQENLNYTVKEVNHRRQNTGNKHYTIGFMFSNQDLDSVLRNDGNDDLGECLFRESFELEDEDLETIKNYIQSTREEKNIIQWFQTFFRISLKIDGEQGKLNSIKLKNSGIAVDFTFNGNNLDSDKHQVSLLFYMPRLWNTVFETAIVDPTRGAHITVNYDEDLMSVDMYSFLNKNNMYSTANTHVEMDGVYEVALSNNEWLLPISGAIFSVKRKK